jgi:hypothetical protein
MIAFFLCYPKRLAPPWLLLAMGPASVALWMSLPLLPGNPSLGGVGQGFTVIEMALIIVAIGVQADRQPQGPRRHGRHPLAGPVGDRRRRGLHRLGGPAGPDRQAADPGPALLAGLLRDHLCRHGRGAAAPQAVRAGPVGVPDPVLPRRRYRVAGAGRRAAGRTALQPAGLAGRGPADRRLRLSAVPRRAVAAHRGPADHEGPRDVRRRRPGGPDPSGPGARSRLARPAGQDLRAAGGDDRPAASDKAADRRRGRGHDPAARRRERRPCCCDFRPGAGGCSARRSCSWPTSWSRC